MISSPKKRHSRARKPRSILKSKSPISLATLSKKVRFVNEGDTNNNIDNDETDQQFFDFIKSKLSKLSIAQRSDLKAFVKAKIPEYFLSLGQWLALLITHFWYHKIITFDRIKNLFSFGSRKPLKH